MSIRSMRTIIKKRAHQERFVSDFKDIGSFIKKTRKKLQLTQDDVANGICSISYLSKIENNQIVPSDHYVNEIMDKLDIDDDVLVKSKRHKIYLEKMIDAYFYQEENKMHQIFLEVEAIKHDKLINIVKLTYYSYFNDQNQSSFVMMLEELIGNMSNLELKFFLYLASVYYMKQNLYKTALELLLISENIMTDNEMVMALLYENNYYIKNRLLMAYSANEDYRKAMYYYQQFNAMKRMVNVGIEKVKQMTKENPRRALKLLIQLKKGIIKQEKHDAYLILEADIMYHMKKYQKALLALKDINESSIYYMQKMVLMYLIFKEEDDRDMMRNVKRLLKEYHPSQEEMHYKIKWHYLTSYDEDKKEYLRDIAIPFSIKTENYNQLKSYIDAMIQICDRDHRYKEALSYIKKYQKELDKIQEILI